MRRIHYLLTVSAISVLLAPVAASAQAIGGTATDTTGAVLPGVTVEARSPVLIEQVRVGITDGAGNYLIVGLRSGAYSVSFNLEGFQVVVREGIALSAGFTAPVDAELGVGTLQETVNVTTASPVVDIRGVNRQRSLKSDVIDTIPSGKSYHALAELLPGMTAAFALNSGTFSDIGGQSGNTPTLLSIHGGAREDHQLQVDGLPAGHPRASTPQSLFAADGNYGELAFNYAANTAEVQTGGVRVNLIPREGGNAFSGRVFANGSGQRLQADNLDDDLIDCGFPPDSQNRLAELWSVDAFVGGPIVRDRLWFHAGHTVSQADNFIAGLFPDSDANDLNFTPIMDPELQTIVDQSFKSTSVRLTWQASRRNKVTGYWDHNQGNRSQNRNAGASVTTEESALVVRRPNDMYQVTWSNPVSTRLLLEAGVSYHPASDRYESDSRVDPTLPPALLLDEFLFVRGIGGWFGGTVAPGAQTRIEDFTTTGYRASLSYVTGSHAVKIGVTGEHLRSTVRPGIDPGQILFTFSDPIRPFAFGQARFTANGTAIENEVSPNLGVYAQDQWTRNRVTINAGLRFDYQRAGYPDQVIGVTRYRDEPFPLRARPRSASRTSSLASGWRTTYPEMVAPQSRRRLTGIRSGSGSRSSMPSTLATRFRCPVCGETSMGTASCRATRSTSSRTVSCSRRETRTSASRSRRSSSTLSGASGGATAAPTGSTRRASSTSSGPTCRSMPATSTVRSSTSLCGTISTSVPRLLPSTRCSFRRAHSFLTEASTPFQGSRTRTPTPWDDPRRSRRPAPTPSVGAVRPGEGST